MKHRLRSAPLNGPWFCTCGEPWGDGECSSACASCHRPQRLRSTTYGCGECGHAWRWGWLLSLHDAKVTWELGKCLPVPDPALNDWCVPWWRPWRRIRVRWPSKVWVCPCCSHDL